MSIKSCLAYDKACKKVLCDKKIISYLLKLCVEEYQNLSYEEIEKLIEDNIEEGNKILPRNNEIITVNNEKIVLDILFTSKYPKSNEKIDTMVNIEAQNLYEPYSKSGMKYPLIKRGIYYVCSLIHIQKGNLFKHNNYQKLKKVNSLWINTSPPEEIKNTIQQYVIKEENKMSKTYKEKKDHYDLMNIVMINLGDEENEELGVLNELFVKNNSVEEKYRNLEEKYGIKLNEEGKRKVETMMNLGEGLVQKTRMQSLEEGRKEGRTEGMQVKTIEFIKRIMKSRNFSYEQVVKHLELTEEEEKQYQEYFM